MTLTVTNTNDSDAGSLRQAILDSNANPPPPNMTNLIQFNIPGSGVHTIALASSLPEISQPVIIDGYTQSGASANTLTVGDNAVIQIKIDGGTGPNSISPMIQLCGNNMCFNGSRGDNCTIRGLSIVQSVVAGGTMITVDSNNNLFVGNFIGVDTDGQTVGGITLMQIGQAGNTIGGTSPAARNVMAANAGGFGLILNDGDNTLVQGNYLGINAAGTAAIGTAGTGIDVEVGSGVTIGGSTPAAGNVINSTNNGVVIQQVNFFFPVSNITVQGNLIGTDATGTAAFHRLNIGILLGLSSNTTIGGNAPGAGNVVSGSGNLGILIQGSPTGVVVQGNKIGTDITGMMPLGNAGCGIQVNASPANATIGGASSGQGNIIAFNGTNGVFIATGSTGWAILGNSIHDNSRLGITLSACGANTPTLNDHCDTDTGANDLQNYPVITSASFSGGNVTLSGAFDSVPNTTFRIEFFSSASCNPSGFGEGQHFLGTTNVTTSGTCAASFGPLTFSLPAGDTVVTATSTILDPSGNPIETSEFSACAALPVPTGAVSRKTHGAAGDFDVNLPFTGTPGVECRTGGATNDYTMVVTFGSSVIVTGNPQAQVTMGTATIGSNGVPNGGMVTVNGNVVTIPLTLVANAQTISVRLNGVNGGSDAPATDVDIPMSALIGDTNANRTVNAADVAQTKARLGQAVVGTNFRSDVNANGSINAADTAVIKQNSGTSLPP